jgi:hypothetical protein
MNLIFGSGITGLLAKKILGDDWELIPFKRSRYFYFEIPWADNFIQFDKDVDDFMRTIIPKEAPVVFYKSPFSCRGQLMYQANPITTDPYLEKVYGDKAPKLAESLLRTTFTVYPVTVKDLHDALQRKYLSEIKDNLSKYGEVASVDLSQRMVRFKNGMIVEYENIISTIPLNAMLDYCGIASELESRSVYYYYIVVSTIDLEGAQQAYVCDSEIDFFKVQMLNKTNYIFWCTDLVPDTLRHFGSILGYNINFVESRHIPEVIPLGDPPDLSGLEERGVFCVGSNAQWDDFMDISSCMKRLLKLAGGEVVK